MEKKKKNGVEKKEKKKKKKKKRRKFWKFVLLWCDKWVTLDGMNGG